MYGLLINGQPAPAPNPLTVDGRRIYNPPDGVYQAAGYKPIVDTPVPEPVEGEEPGYYTSTWEERDGQIVRVWTPADPPEPPEPAPPTLDERVGALETSAAEMSEALNMILTGVVE